jgi:hypothetical protein
MNDRTVYVVSGYMRTGTSMMMKALMAGGMSGEYRESREEMRKRHSDSNYDPNKDGLFELDKEEYHAFGFPNKFEGKLIKVLHYGASRMSVMEQGIRIIYMRRDIEEVRQSFNAFFERQIPPEDMGDVERETEDIIKRLGNRKDVLSLDVFWYREVLKEPMKYFLTLKDHGWPIDVDKSVAVVDPSRIRYKKENLTEGVI